jgi:hypothetical protein
LAGDLLHPVGAESLAHRLDRQFATGVPADRCQTQRSALSIDRDDRLSLTAEGDRSYLIAPARALSRYGGQKRLGGSKHGLSVEDDPALPGPLEDGLLSCGCDLLACSSYATARTPLVPRSTPIVLTSWSSAGAVAKWRWMTMGNLGIWRQGIDDRTVPREPIAQNCDICEARFVNRIVQSRYGLPAGPPSHRDSSSHGRTVGGVAMSGPVGKSEYAADDSAP